MSDDPDVILRVTAMLCVAIICVAVIFAIGLGPPIAARIAAPLPATEPPPARAGAPTDAQVDGLMRRLHDYAQSVNPYTFGLPVEPGRFYAPLDPPGRMRRIYREWDVEVRGHALP